MPAVEPADVTSLTEGDVATVVPLITTMARAYTRGQGFVGNVPNEEIAAVITTAAARFTGNPAQISTADTAGPFSRDVRSFFNGWTLPELYVLNRYRRRAM